MGERSLGTADIGRTHPRKECTIEFFRGKRDGYAENMAEDTVFPENRPERFAFPQKQQRWLGNRNGILAYLDGFSCMTDSRR